MPKNRALVIPAVLLGLVLLVVAVIYFAETAHSLPSFFPGHTSAGGKTGAHHHTKHGIAAVVVAAGCFIFAWFQSGPAAAGGAAARQG
jgi:hypothetical protein